MGDDDAPYVTLAQPMGAALGQCLPGGMVHVFAVKLGDLFAHQTVALQGIVQAGHGVQQMLHAELPSGVARVVTGAGGSSRDGAACA